MHTYAVVQAGGKQYLVKPDDCITVGKIDASEKDVVELPVLGRFSEDGDAVSSLELANGNSLATAKAEVIEQLKGDKVRVARFKSKVRYRKVHGHRSHLTKLRIVKV